MKNKIRSILKAGIWIRLQDGRYPEGFVNLDILEELISSGEAEVFNNQGGSNGAFNNIK